MNKVITVAVLVLGLFAAASIASGQEAEAESPVHAKYVILMIGDGMGFNHVDAASLYKHERTGALAWERFPVKYAMSTYPAGGSYDSQAAWKSFDAVKSGATDSAAAATALATGVKTYNGAIGVDEDKKPLGNVSEAAEALGRSTGVVTTVTFPHATPASFVAHNEERDNYSPIALEMLEKSSADVIMGVGHPLYDDDGHAEKTEGDEERYRYAGGKGEWEKIIAGKAGDQTDADHNGVKDDAWTFVETREGFEKLMTGAAPKRVLGMPQVYGSLQNGRSGHDENKKDDMPFETPRISTVPTLAEMTAAALNVLDANEKGFFLMVEGGSIDSAAHSNLSGRMIEEALDFEGAVMTAIEWVEKNSNWDETLLIVTADHETGYLTGVGSGEGKGEGEESIGKPVWNAVAGDGVGRMPLMEWHSGGHTNSLVGIWAKGNAAGLFEKYADESDPVRGSYIDNTEVAKVIFEAMK